MESRWNARQIVGFLLLVVGVIVVGWQVFRLNASQPLVAIGLVVAFVGLAAIAGDEEEEIA